EVYEKELCVHGKIHGAREDLRRVVIVAENERAVDHNAVISEAPNCSRIVTVAQVPLLVHLSQVECVEGFESDQSGDAAAALHQCQQPWIVSDIDADLAAPVDFQWDHCAKQLLGACSIDKQIVIDQQDEPAVELFDLRHNFVNRTLTKAAAVKGVNRTEVARVLATAPVLHRSRRSIALVFEDASIEFQTRE